MKHFQTILGTLFVLALCHGALARTALSEPHPDRRPAAVDKTPLEQLTPKERAYLEEKVKGWAARSDREKQQLAQRVLRLRSVTPEQRELLEARIRKLEERRERGAGPRRGPHPTRDPREMRQHLEVQGKLMHLIGSELWSKLSKESRAEIVRVLGRDGRHRVNDRFFRAVWQKLAEARVADGRFGDFELSENSPEHLRRKVEQLRTKAAEGDEGARLRLAHIAVGYAVRNQIQPLLKDGRIDVEAVRRLADEFVQQHPELIASVKAELEKAAADTDTLRAWVRPRGGRGPGFGSHGAMADPRRLFQEFREATAELKKALHDLEPLLAEHPELAKRVKRLRKALRRMEDLGRGGSRPGGGGMRGPGQPGGHGGMRGPGQPGGRRGPGGRPGRDAPGGEDPGEGADEGADEGAGGEDADPPK